MGAGAAVAAADTGSRPAEVEEPVTITSFRGWNRRDDYDAYRRIKHLVFVVEQGWKLEGDPEADLVAPDAFDERGRFWLARTAAGVPIGVIRGLPVREGFPHRELFRHHLDRAEMAGALLHVGTLNALAVLSPYRRRRYRVLGDRRVGSAAALLLLSCLRGLAGEGVIAAVATVQGLPSARAVMAVGFRLIDRPLGTSLHHDFRMANVGIVLGSAAHREADARCGLSPLGPAGLGATARALDEYFDRRQDEILGSAPLEALFAPLTAEGGGAGARWR